jgi:hypothetical protein
MKKELFKVAHDSLRVEIVTTSQAVLTVWAQLNELLIEHLVFLLFS